MKKTLLSALVAGVLAAGMTGQASAVATEFYFDAYGGFSGAQSGFPLPEWYVANSTGGYQHLHWGTPQGDVESSLSINLVNPDDLALTAIDAGAEDVKIETDDVEIYTKVEDIEAVRAALEQKSVEITSSEISMVPKTLVQLDEKPALQALKLLDKLEEIDGVQNVYSNADFPDTIVEQYHQLVAAER